ncbi:MULTISPECIES: alkaline phosphatase D family protein [Actibacterium]|uniref:Alkaline phosphatase D n=1 Tax=Actibacterium naphthalenivorans TaxID=1614693 RepID=A0A840CB30_9RHOB|nr:MULTISPECIES: alkaline phosphatase D family protein [Actibacterium]ALG90617.1 alkaline phosphatase [Actibacterium sp. EMB200-NS6]MBB4023211.1 alkaline phosphatase D [Actibacterium naphthalenivorans]
MPSIRFTRRQALVGSAALASTLAMPSISRANGRPVLTHGVQSGDVAHDGAVLWARADREAKMAVEWSTTESFANARKVQALNVGTATDFTGKLALEGLPSDQDVFYRVTMTDLADANAVSAPVTGHFRTAPMALRDISFVWSGDTAGQGWGIDESRGGMTTYKTMLGHTPDFMIHSGDTVYADGPLKSEVELKDGTVWKNLVTEQKTKVAETLDEFRGQHLYNMLDANVRAFNAEVPVMYQWDDHEVTNNWYPNEMLISDDRYKVKSMQQLSARAARAFHEMYPIRSNLSEPYRVYRKVSYGPLLDIFFIDMRSYRGDNTANNQPEGAPFLGAEQLAWLKRELTASNATWKVIASDMPIGMVVRDGDNFENGANSDGPPLGRELDIADLLSFIKHGAVKNTVWLTADVHYTAAHHYSPDRAQFQDFDPFWEFVSGPLHAGTFGPNDYDNTFGVEVRYAKHPSEEQGVNLPPSMGLQFFGKVDIAADTGVMTVSLLDSADTVLWATEIEPDMA